MRLEKQDYSGGRDGWSGRIQLLVLLICFLLGSIFGFIFAFSSEPSHELRIFFEEYFDFASRSMLQISFVSVLFDCIRWPLIMCVFGFTAVGAVIIPGAMAFRGFLLAYTTTCLSVLFGHYGITVAAATFSVTILFVLPAVFLIACEGFRSACFLASKGTVAYDNPYRLEVVLPGIGVLALAIALQWTVVPKVLTAVCIHFSV